MNTSVSVSYKLLSSFKVFSKTGVLTPNLLLTKSKKKNSNNNNRYCTYIYITPYT